MKKLVFLLVSLSLIGCGGGNSGDVADTPAVSRSVGATRRNQIQIFIKSGGREWQEERSVVGGGSGYVLDRPITLPEGAVDEIFLRSGEKEIARFSGNDMKVAGWSVTAMGRPLVLSFRKVPESLEIQWLNKEAAEKSGARGEGGMLIGAYRVRNPGKSELNLGFRQRGWARLSQWERQWRLENPTICPNVHTNPFAQRQVEKDIEVRLVGERNLRPGQEKILAVVATGAAAEALSELRMLGSPVAPQKAQAFLFLGRSSVAPSSRAFPVCHSEPNVWGMHHMFNIGLERSGVSFQISGSARGWSARYADEPNAVFFRTQEFPAIGDSKVFE